MATEEKDVQGVAVYAEWTKPESLMQVIFTPDGYTTENMVVRASMYRRITTLENPKKQWNATFLESVTQPILEWEPNSSENLPNKHVQAHGEARLEKVTVWFNTMLLSGWEMVKSPLLIEISKKDMDDIFVEKTPSKFMYRVDLARKALGFPEPLKAEG
jgi:hypothetical protein